MTIFISLTFLARKSSNCIARFVNLSHVYFVTRKGHVYMRSVLTVHMPLRFCGNDHSMKMNITFGEA